MTLPNWNGLALTPKRLSQLGWLSVLTKRSIKASEAAFDTLKYRQLTQLCQPDTNLPAEAYKTGLITRRLQVYRASRICSPTLFWYVEWGVNDSFFPFYSKPSAVECQYDLSFPVVFWA